MSDPVVYKNGSDWDDERIARTLSQSAKSAPGLSKTRRANVLNALLDEEARVAAQVEPANAPHMDSWSDERLARLLVATEKNAPALNEERQARMLAALRVESARLAMEEAPATAQPSVWDEARVDQLLLASAEAVPALPETRRAPLLQALAAENARLSAQEKALAPAPPSLWERLRRLVNPRVLTALAGTLAALVFLTAYFLLGGTQSAIVARADGSFALAEARQGVLGLRWQVPRTYAGASAANIHIGDLVIATTPVTITFDDGTQAVAAVGSQLRMLPGQTVELVAGELVASTSAQTDQFTVQSIGATFVVSDATFRVMVDETGNVSQFTDAGRVIAMTPSKSVEVLAGEQANVLKDSDLPVKGLQPPVVAGQRNENGTLEFTARTLKNSTVVLVDSETGNELASFQADENGLVSGAIVPPASISAENLTFRANAPDGRQSTSSVAVNDNIITSASNQTRLPPAPPPSTAGTMPILSLPALAPAQATSRNGAQVRFEASASDATDGSLPVNCNFGPGTTFPIGLTEVVCTATNSQGRTATGSFKVSVVDLLPPIIRLPQNRIQAPAVSAAGASITFTVSAMDTVDGQVPVTCTARTGQTFPLGATSVQCTAADAFGNATQGSFEIVVRDEATPQLRLPDTITAQATGRSGAEIAFSATAMDQIDGATPVNCTPASGTVFASGTTTVNCTTTDKAGNATSGSFTVNVRDNIAPALTVPDALSVQATSSAGAQVAFSATASDAVDGSLGVSCSPRPGSTFPLGTTAVACRVSDSAGNSATRTFNVTVADTLAPRLDLPAALNVAATGPNGAPVSFSAAATDTVDSAVTTSCTPRSGSVFPLGTTAVACRATDARGNQATGTFNITVRDTAAPVFTLPGVITAEAETPAGAVVNFNATARDAIDGALPATCAPAAGVTFPLGSTTVRCSATDKAGNAATETLVVNVTDTRPPVLRLPENTAAKAVSRAGAPVTFTVSALDVIDGVLTPACTPRSGAVFGIGDTTVSCRVIDSAGNTATGAFKITVANTSPPALALPASPTAEATGPGGTTVVFTATATSVIDGPLAPVCTPASGSTFGLGVTPVTCRATDSTGLSTTDRFNVTVVDTAPPALSLPALGPVEASNGKRGAAVTFNASATDKADESPVVVCTPASGSTFNIGSTAVTCRATDGAGNSASGTFNVVVQDTVAPVIQPQADLKAEATSPAGAVVTFNVVANDAADGTEIVTCTPASGSLFPIGTTAVTCRATDQAGNGAAPMTFNVGVADTRAPALSLPGNLTATTTSLAGAPVTFIASATDGVDGAIAPTCTPASGTNFPVGNSVVACTATDKAGNSSSNSFMVTVQLIDTVPPVLVLPDTITVQSQNSAGINVSYLATANDAVDGPLAAVCVPPSGALFSLGPTRVECTATDRAGNRAAGSFMVVVTPAPANVPPTITPTVTSGITPAATLTPTVIAQQTPITPINFAAAGPVINSTTPPTDTLGLPPTP
jgi:hypothetical protein